MNKIKEVLENYDINYKHNISEYINELRFELNNDWSQYSDSDKCKKMLNRISTYFNKETDPAKRHMLKILIKDINKVV